MLLSQCSSKGDMRVNRHVFLTSVNHGDCFIFRVDVTFFRRILKFCGGSYMFHRQCCKFWDQEVKNCPQSEICNIWHKICNLKFVSQIHDSEVNIGCGSPLNKEDRKFLSIYVLNFIVSNLFLHTSFLGIHGIQKYAKRTLIYHLLFGTVYTIRMNLILKINRNNFWCAIWTSLWTKQNQHNDTEQFKFKCISFTHR